MTEKELYHMINTEGLREVCSTISCTECPLAANCGDNDKCWDKMEECWNRMEEFSKSREPETKVLISIRDCSDISKVFVKVPESYLKFLSFLAANDILYYEREKKQEITEF